MTVNATYENVGNESGEHTVEFVADGHSSRRSRSNSNRGGGNGHVRVDARRAGHLRTRGRRRFGRIGRGSGAGAAFDREPGTSDVRDGGARPRSRSGSRSRWSV
ncbi:hypothetical protein D8S78_05485 [Natrialba swarupiae]|nr:hypothetical protein [Natrialba swarupiae]